MTEVTGQMSVDWTKVVRDSLDSRPHLNLPRRLKLPVLPQSVIAFTEIAENPDAGPHQLAAPLEADASLTSELLRQINSASMGLKQKVASVAQAIGLLGPRRTKTLVLTSALQTATKDTTSRLIHTLQFQRENYIRAVFAREAARATGADAEIAYVAGLLQDFLLPLLTEAFYSDYAEIIRQGSEMIEKERDLFGWDHASVAAGLIREWGLPDELVASVLFHHDAARVILDPELGETSVAAVVTAGCLPDCVGQSPSGFDTLLVLQDVLPEFRALEIAYAVDEEFVRQGQNVNLSERFNQLALENLEQRRFDRIHHYRKLGNYTLEDQIGEGGMGVVYRAKHCMLKRPAAIKLLHSTKISPESLARFESEVQLTCGLTSPHTVAVYDYGETAEGLFYYVMEYLEGITLAQLVQRHGPQPGGRVIHFLKQACLSLAEAHATGLIHRDLKPENLMICCRGGVADTLKVLDFGLARTVSKHMDPEKTAGALAGTPRYMSPEAIISGQSLDARSDIYSLGAVGYFLLTGQPVFPGKDLATLLKCHVQVQPQRPAARLGRPIDKDLEDIVLQCLEKSRHQRPSSAQNLHERLNQCQSSQAWTADVANDWWADVEVRPQGQSSNSVETRPLSKTVIGGEKLLKSARSEPLTKDPLTKDSLSKS